MTRQQPEQVVPRRAWATNRPYVEERSLIRVSFHQVDPMGIVWHGHYIAFFEDARRGFARKYGIDYPVFMEHDLAAPVVQAWADYLSPARMGDLLDATARFYRPESVRMEFGYEIRLQSDGRLIATGGTVQVLTTPAGQLALAWPPFMKELFLQLEPLWINP